MSFRRLTLAFVLLAAGCGDGMEGPDAALSRDAALADGGGLLDGGSELPADSGGAASDAGAPGYCPYDACDPRYPDGCSDGSCVLWSPASSCEGMPGALANGMACTSVSDCAPGLACFLTPSGGVCGRICCPGDPAACIGDAFCAGSGMLVDGTQTEWGQCLPPRSCDVLHPADTCEPREGCYIIGADATTECRVAGVGGPGDACMAQEDCQSGFFCGGIGTSRHCVRICALGAGDCPTAEGRCVAQVHSPTGTGFCTVDTTMVR